jgi:hypothetical protein
VIPLQQQQQQRDDEFRVYLSAGADPKSKFGGLHITLASAALYHDVADLRRRVCACMHGVLDDDQTFTLNAHNSELVAPGKVRITSLTLAVLLERMRAADIANVPQPDTLHIELPDVGAAAKTTLNTLRAKKLKVYIVRKTGADTGAWDPVPLDGAWTYPAVQPGSGVILFDGSTFTLFHDKRGYFMDAGGVRETAKGKMASAIATAKGGKMASAIATAQTELLEESAGLFDIDLADGFRKGAVCVVCSSPPWKHDYVCFVVRIAKIAGQQVDGSAGKTLTLPEMFASNHATLDAPPAAEWKWIETDELGRFQDARIRSALRAPPLPPQLLSVEMEGDAAGLTRPVPVDHRAEGLLRVLLDGKNPASLKPITLSLMRGAPAITVKLLKAKGTKKVSLIRFEHPATGRRP